MLIQIPRLQQAPPPYDAPRKITPRLSPVALFSDGVGVDEEEADPALGSGVDLGARVESLFNDVSPTTEYKSETGLYFAARRPSCRIIGLGRSNACRSDEVHITVSEHILHISESIQEHKQPYSLFIIDALPQDAVSSVEAIVRETAHYTLYFNHRPLVSVVEKGAAGLLSRLQERYSGTPLRFIEAKKYGVDVIDAQLFGQLRY